MKSKEDLREYIHSYKSDLLSEIDRDTEKLNSYANDTDARLGSQLMLLASALIAVLGTLAGGELASVRVTMSLSALSLILSISAGLKNYYDISKFWEAAGAYKHEEGKLVINDRAKTHPELEAFRTDPKYRDGAPIRSSDLARIVQYITFTLGVIFFSISFGILAFSK